MTWFDEFSSNTLAAGGNQSVCFPTGEQVGRVYYRVFAGGEYRYSLLFADTIDSTYADGSLSRAEEVCGAWEITHLALGVCREVGKAPTLPLTIGGAASHAVTAGETFTTDPVTLAAEAGDYLCVEIGFRGDKVPCHLETQIPVYRREGDRFVPSAEVPLPSMVGCDRPVKRRVGYLGDSITQGIGVAPNSYAHWNAVLSEALGRPYAYHNLGLGFGRAADAAKDGAWLAKAKRNDVVTVCFGVNDLGRGRTADEIVGDLAFIVRSLKEAGCRVLLQSVPPFTYTPEHRTLWATVNRRLAAEVAQTADAFFDVETVLGSDSERYGGHPNEAGCLAWGQALIPYLKKLLEY